MPRQEHVLSVFIASPSDVTEERQRLEEIVRELNITWSRYLGLRLELIRWETHAYPDIGIDAQDVINHQIGDDYDIFIGIMWSRFGTSTGRAESGTVEEFNRAKTRHDADSNSVAVMFYFKDEAIPLSKLDIPQITSIREFRTSLGGEGSLYWVFKDNDEFETLLRMHLIRIVQSWLSKSKINKLETEIVLISDQSIELRDDEFGMLDLLDSFEEEFSELTDIGNRIAYATEEIGSKMNQRTDEMNQLNKISNGAVNRSDFKKLISKASHDLDQYAQRMEAEMPFFATHFDSGMNFFIKAASISIDDTLDKGNFENIQAGLDGISTLHNTLLSIEPSISYLQSVVFVLPRLTTDLNRSKKRVVAALGTFLEQLRKACTLCQEAESIVKDILQRRTSVTG
jgi:uncharacterized protein YjiS (DUF1127 family)